MSTEYPYYLPDEVVIHNEANDCWVSCLGRVYDLTEYVAQTRESPISKYLIAYAGKDVSHWFDVPRKVTRQKNGKAQRQQVAKLKRYTEPNTGQRQILLPFSTPIPSGMKSKFVPVGKQQCGCCCANSFNCCDDDNCSDDVNYSLDDTTKLTGECWIELEYIFNSAKYQRGLLTKNPRPCRITNVLTGQRAIISVCEEDSIRRIQERALILNRHGASYTWKYEGKPLNLALSLTDNGIIDERDRYLAAGLPADGCTTYVPNLLCYYNDDLTEL